MRDTPWRTGLHHGNEIAEQVVAVVRSRRCLRMVLHAKDRELAMTEPLIRSVIQVGMCDFNGPVIEGIRIDRKSMILRGDFNFSRQKIFHRVVCTAVAELELERLPAESKSEKLMSEANAKDWFLPNELLYVFNCNPDRRRVTRTI